MQTNQPRDSKKQFANTLGTIVVKILDSIVNTVVLCIFLLFFLYGSYMLWQSDQVFQAASSKEYVQYRPTAENEGISFAALQKINPDVFAWLTIYGTNIDYPLTHTDNNETYVNTDVMGHFSVSGSLFLDSRNAVDFADFNSIIYGHHMDKEAMFGGLAQYTDPAYLASHKYANLYYDGKDHGLEFFAFLEADAYDTSIYKPVILEGAEEEYVSHLIANSIHSREITITPDDHIVLLTTCTVSSTNGRHILAGKITDEVYPDPDKTDTGDTVKEIKTVDSPSASAFNQVPLAFLMIPFILLILIILYLICSKGRKGAHERKSEE